MASVERLAERKALVLDYFSRQFEGRINHSIYSWVDLANVMGCYIDTCIALTERAKRKNRNSDSEPQVTLDVNCVVKDIQLMLLDIVRNPSYPVSPFFKEKSLSWLSQQFEVILTERNLPSTYESFTLDTRHTSEKDSNYAFKSYFVADGVKVCLLEENNNPMGNEEGATGLITWQGAYCLYYWLISAYSNILPEKAKVLELGSGAGYFGIALLLSGFGVSRYTFTDIHYNVLNTLVANVKINLVKQDVSFEDMNQWLDSGPPQQVHRTGVEETLVTHNLADDTTAVVRYLDWLNCSDSIIDSLDYDIIFGSDLTYTKCMLLPLAQLLKRFLSKKKAEEQKVSAYIACTHRNADIIDAFLNHLVDVGLTCSAVIKSTFGPNEGLTITHEPLKPVTVFRIENSQQ